MKLENIKVIMVGTTHPGNIGAAARAMNNMCFTQLVLVDPQCPIGEVAYARASGANAILDAHKIHDRLETAIADCQYVIATSARRRSLAWPELEPREMVEKLSTMEAGSRAALVFGREHSGLTNEEIQLCNGMVCIPTNPEFSSLNIASAIQVLCYEIFRQQSVKPDSKIEDKDLPASSAEVEGYFTHLKQLLEDYDLLDPEQPGTIMTRFRRLYLRSELTHKEINILRGMLTAIEKQRR